MKKKLIIIVSVFVVLFIGSAIISGIKNGTSSEQKQTNTDTKENKKETIKKATHKDFSITDGETYKDIETLDNGRVYVLPSGKYEITKLEDGTIKPLKLTFTNTDTKENKEVVYKSAFDYEIKDGEHVELMIAGDNAQLYFKALN